MTAAFLKGLADTVNNPEEAYTISKKYVPDLAKTDETTQKEILRRTIELWKTKHYGESDAQAWENMQATLLKMGLLRQPLDVNKAFTNEFVP
jgi:NitT/TauT family transport system substrate-binding protein